MIFVLILSIVMILYTILGYPLALFVLSSFAKKRLYLEPAKRARVEFVVPAHNEAAVIGEKIKNTLEQDNPDGHELHVIVVSDGSDDGTVDIARAIQDSRVDVIETAGRSGKLEALNLAMSHCTGDYVIFSDANGMLSKGAMTSMIRHFEDPSIGGVCGKIYIQKGAEIAKADGLFWRYDQMMKLAESNLGGVVSAQGSLYAMRRSILAPVPDGFSDDNLISMRAVEQGYRLSFEPNATSGEAVTEKAGSEMQRRVRSTLMGWRTLMSLKHLMNPFSFGLYAWQLISHKFLRRMTPVFLLMALGSNLMLIGETPLLTALAYAQLAFYGLAFLSWAVPPVRRIPGAAKVMFFVMSNLAMAIGVYRYYRGDRISAWTPVRDG